MPQIIININGVGVPLDEIRGDLEAVIKKGLSYKYAFTPETVRGLIETIDSLSTTTNDEK